MSWVKINQGHVIVNLNLATRLYLMDQTARQRGFDIVADFGEYRQMVVDRADTIQAAIDLLAGYLGQLNQPAVTNIVNNPIVNNPPKAKAKTLTKTKTK